MSRAWSVAYSVVAILVFLATGAYVLMALDQSRERSLGEARAALSRAADRLSSVEDGDSLRRLASTTVRTNPQIRALLVRKGDQTEYLFASDPGLVVGPSLPEATSLKTNTVFQASLTLETRTGVTVEAVYGLVGNADVFSILRNALAVALGFALLTTVLLVIGALRRRAATGPEEGESETPAEDEGPAAVEPSREADRPVSVEAPVEAEELEAEDEIEDLPRDESESVDNGLFSPATGLSYRSHLDHRLDQEIQRAAYNEEDVSLALLSFPGLMATDGEYREIAAELLSTFRFPELLFEFADDSFCVILPNTGLDDAIRRLEEFVRRFPNLPSHSGLTSRNGRLVDGRRLLMESERARRKAETESASIIGFRPDPDRYRTYLTGAE